MRPIPQCRGPARKPCQMQGRGGTEYQRVQGHTQAERRLDEQPEAGEDRHNMPPPGMALRLKEHDVIQPEYAAECRKVCTTVQQKRDRRAVGQGGHLRRFGRLRLPGRGPETVHRPARKRRLGEAGVDGGRIVQIDFRRSVAAHVAQKGFTEEGLRRHQGPAVDRRRRSAGAAREAGRTAGPRRAGLPRSAAPPSARGDSPGTARRRRSSAETRTLGPRG